MDEIGEVILNLMKMSQSNQKTTGSASFPKPSPCKKFTLAMKIKNEVRAAMRRTNVWTHLTSVPLLKRFEHDVNNKIVPVRGAPFKPIEFSIVDVASLLDHVDIELKEPMHAKRLRDSPLFSEKFPLISLEKENETQTFEVFKAPGTHKDFLEIYQLKHNRYLARQHHKIDGAFSYDMWATYSMLS